MASFDNKTVQFWLFLMGTLTPSMLTAWMMYYKPDKRISMEEKQAIVGQFDASLTTALISIGVFEPFAGP